jgi:hypothetical protein
MDNLVVQEILKKLDADREAYLATLSQVHKTLAHVLAQSNSIAETPTPADPNVRIPNSSAFPGSPTLPPSIRGNRPGSGSVLELGSYKKGSIFTGEESSDSEDDESFFVQNTLPKEHFSEEDLVEHLSTYDWSSHGRLMLGDLVDKKSIPSPLFDDTGRTYADIYEVGADGSAISINREDTSEGTATAWEGLRGVNHYEAKRKAVGKIIAIREPTAILAAATHLTMNRHFDMDNIFRLLTDDTVSRAYLKGCLLQDPRHHRSFMFSFKYHTIVEDEQEPLPWQQADNDLKSTWDHIPISTCASIVALSLSGPPSQTLRRKSRRKKQIMGQVHDPFAPWRVLSMVSDLSFTIIYQHTNPIPSCRKSICVCVIRDMFRHLTVLLRRRLPPKCCLRHSTSSSPIYYEHTSQAHANEDSQYVTSVLHFSCNLGGIPNSSPSSLKYRFAQMKHKLIKDRSQCYPDWKSTVDVHEKNRHYVNGPEAFLVTLLAEYQDASKRFMLMNKRIVKMVTPPSDFLFNKTLRDQLLFENDKYTYSRRYFWAFQALALLNDEIQAIVSAYKNTFTDDVWSGEHKYIW